MNSRRFSVQRLRSKFMYFFRLLSRCKHGYGRALQALKRGICMENQRHGSLKRNSSCSSTRSLVMERSHVSNNGKCDYRYQSFSRSNSFYAEAIADCLEFIKRTSISDDQNDLSVSIKDKVV